MLSFSSSKWSKPAWRPTAFFDSPSATLLSSLKICWKVILEKEEIRDLVLWHQCTKVITCISKQPVAQSTITFESPNTWIDTMPIFDANLKSPKSTKSLAPVLVPAPQPIHRWKLMLECFLLHDFIQQDVLFVGINNYFLKIDVAKLRSATPGGVFSEWSC